MTNITLPSPHKIRKIIHETQAEYTFRVGYEGQVDHGQFFVLSIPKIGEAPISVSGMGEGTIDFTIRKVGKLTSGIFGMREGDTLFMRGPYGNSFPLEEFKGKDLVVIAGGTGICAVRSTLQYFSDHMDELCSLTLIAGFKDRKSVLFQQDLEEFKSKFKTIYTLDEEENGYFQKGFVTEYVKDVPFSKFQDYNVIVVGPPKMIDATAKECIANGVAEDKLWVSFERKMSCSVGKCGHCKINEVYVCLEGPVFNYTEGKRLLD